MSMSGAVVTGILMMVIMYILLTMPGIVDNVIIFEETDKEATNLENIVENTNINLSSLGSSVGSNIVTSIVYNNGNEKLWNFGKFDYIIEYNSTNNARQLEQISYAGDCGGSDPNPGTWCIDSFISDTIEQKILNNFEGMSIKASTSQNINFGKLITTLSTDHGVSSSISKTVT